MIGVDPPRIEPESLTKTTETETPGLAAGLTASLESRRISPTHPDDDLWRVPHDLLSNRNVDCTLGTSRDGERRIIAS